jgi:arabinan endo-1,5-alpha-L-arabinosidase
MEPRSKAMSAIALALLLTLADCGHSRTAPPMRLATGYQSLPAVDPLQGNMVPVHDPAIIRRPDGTWLVLSTDIPFLHPQHFLEQRCSQDLVNWHGCGYIFPSLPGWVKRQYPGADGLWAPDISYFGGRYHLYYAVSLLGSQRSAIGQAVSNTLGAEDHWQDTGPILQSGPGEPFNAIDPYISVEPATATKPEKVWLTYGSFWGGIYQEEVDPKTGGLIPGGRRYHLARQPSDRHGAIEGAALIVHNGFYYLFASVGACCEIPIERDTYQEIVGRSRSMHGPFIDQQGRDLLQGGGSIVLTSDRHWLAPGGASLWQSPDRQQTLISFHALDRSHNGALYLWIMQVTWPANTGGWPVLQAVSAAPSNPSGPGPITPGHTTIAISRILKRTGDRANAATVGFVAAHSGASAAAPGASAAAS